MKYFFPALLLLFSLSSVTFGAASDEKLAAAKRYLATTPMSAMVNDMTAKMAIQMPADQRDNFIKTMTEEVDIKLLESTALEAMVETFTLEELNAFADFYGSEVGQSAMSKFGTYMSLVMPAIQQEMVRAIKTAEGTK